MPRRPLHPIDARAKLDAAGGAYAAARLAFEQAATESAQAARQASDAGIEKTEIVRRLGVSRATVYSWLARVPTKGNG